MADKPVVLISGASGGLGPAVVDRFCLAGYQVVTVARKSAASSAPCSCHEILADVLDETQVRNIALETMQRHHRIDALVNLVGGIYPWSTVESVSPDVWEKTIALNLRSVFLMVREVLPLMKTQKHGKLVNISAGLGVHGTSMAGPYGVAKAGVINLTQTIAAECKSHNIQCNVVVPSTIDTPDNRRAMPNADFSKWVTPAEVAGVIHYLCSDESNGVTGSTIMVPGRV